jgi:hypothetical protein
MKGYQRPGNTGIAGILLLALSVPAGAQTIVWDGNVLFDNTVNGCNDAAVSGQLETPVLFGTPFRHNRVDDPALVNAASLTAPDFRPTAGSRALCANFHPVVTVPDDGFFTQTWYSGALDPGAPDWTAGWATYDFDGNPADFNLGKPLVVLSGILPTQTLVSTNNYVIEGRVSVAAGNTLTIQAGTHIFGSTTVTPSYLVIERDGNIVANGTANAPIIFTSENAPFGTANSGNWGGVVIHGKACANCAATDMGASCTSEGGAGDFGGTDDADNSGSMQYVRIEFAGFEVAPNNELNCLTMNALGTGTSISYIQAHRGSDDLFEWFGGAVDNKYLLGTHGQDDGLDFQMGYRGRVQFAVVQQRALTGADKAIEGDNNEFNHANALCRSNPTFSNLTLIGTRTTDGQATAIGGGGIHFRRGARGQVLNSIVQGFRNCAFDFDDAETVAGGFGTGGVTICGGVSAVGDDTGNGARPMIARAFPNPFHSSARIAFSLPESRQAAVRIFSMDGRLIDTIVNGRLNAGNHEFDWAPSDLSNGIYFYRVDAGGYRAQGRLVYVR